MHSIISIVAALLPCAVLVQSTAPAPLLGPAYPYPTNLTQNSSLVLAAWSDFTATVESLIRANQTVEGLVPDLGSFTFSVGAFSIYDAAAGRTLQYHHTGPAVQKTTIGVQNVNGDSVYRVESISKLFTVYLVLLEIGSGCWDIPLTDFVSELATFADGTKPHPLHVVDWKDVTLGALAGQIAGIPHETTLANTDLLVQFAEKLSTIDPTTIGLPPIDTSNPSLIDPCATFVNATGTFCPIDPYIQAVTEREPVFAPWTTPTYSDLGFSLLSLALENITGNSYSDMLQDRTFCPLEMTSSRVAVNFTNAVVPGGINSSAGSAFATTDFSELASGGIYSSTNDLA